MSTGRDSLFDALDLTLRCPTCGARADMCFAHGDEWKKRPAPHSLHAMTDAQLRASVNEFTQDDPPPYGTPMRLALVNGEWAMIETPVDP